MSPRIIRRPGRGRRRAGALLCGAVLLSACGTQAAVGPADAGPTAHTAAASSSTAVKSTTGQTPVSGSSGSSLIPPSVPPPYIDYVEWVQTGVGPSLQIHPTPAGRRVIGGDADDVAWREVLALAPDGDTPGMRMQFDCHWVFARMVEPDKPSWNLEPGRPVVSEQEMIATRCNPGFSEE